MDMFIGITAVRIYIKMQILPSERRGVLTLRTQLLLRVEFSPAV